MTGLLKKGKKFWQLVNPPLGPPMLSSQCGLFDLSPWWGLIESAGSRPQPRERAVQQDRARELLSAQFAVASFPSTVPEGARPGVHYQLFLLKSS